MTLAFENDSVDGGSKRSERPTLCPEITCIDLILQKDHEEEKYRTKTDTETKISIKWQQDSHELWIL